MGGRVWWVNRRAPLWTVAWVLSLAVGASPAPAQISSLLLEPWDLGYQFSRNSARLSALAGIWTSVEDESNEINMWDYGGNVAGFLDDRDAWCGDFWAVTENLDRRQVGVGSSGEVVESGVQVSFRSRSFDRALGLEGNLTKGTDESQDGEEKSDFSGPVVTAVGNQALWDKLILGAAVTFVDEEQKTTSADPLAIEHDTSRWDYRFGVVYFPAEKIDLGATLTLSDNRIKGTSEDPFHRDRYDWDRPVTQFGVQAVYGAETRLQGGAFVRRTLLDGGEFLRISWSREFFVNPSGVDIALDVPLLNEERKETEAGTRWLARVTDRLDVGADLSYRSLTHEISADPTFSRFLRSTDEDLSELTVSGGVGLRPLAAFLVLGQVDLVDRDLDETILETLRTTATTGLGLRAGVEYFWQHNVAVRGGVRLGTVTVEVDDARTSTDTDYDRLEWTGGLGWAPRGGILMLDIAAGYTSVSASGAEAPDDETDGLAFRITGRTLFR